MHDDGELPENWQGKPKDAGANRSTALLWLIVGLLLLIVASGTLLGIVRPDLYARLFPNIAATQTSAALQLAQTQQAFASTAQADAQRATQSALDLQGTQTGLIATQNAFDQAGTQAALAANAARTATVQAIAAQATSDTLALAGTQAALELASTQAALDTQGTLAALAATPTAAALIPPTTTPVALIADSFVGGLNATLWNFRLQDWTQNAAGRLLAFAARSRLLTQRSDFVAYTLEATLEPPAAASDSYLLHLASSGASWALRLRWDGRALTEAALFSGSVSPLETLRATAALTGANFAAPTVFVEVQVSAGQIVVAVNYTRVLTFTLDALAPGALGVDLAAGSVLNRIGIVPG
ncbi:MAG: hypothetical protein HXY40_12550 [Chloroflexi bacterium]|nr:hypothetical protein [Chloroflexota bacterium]